jgi:hypothetical protein
MTKTRSSFVVMAMLAMAAVGCSEGASRLSPIGPSPVANVAAPVAASALEGWAAANGWSTMADGRVAVADGMVVEGTDVVGSVTGTCPSRSITVRGVAVTVTASTVFAAPLTCASLASGTPVNVTAVLTQGASGLSVTATHLSSPNSGTGRTTTPPSPNRGGERVGGEGVVGAVRGACPVLSLVVSGYSVQTTESTEFKTACEAVREGTRVKLEVERHDDGRMLAVWIEAVR